MNVDSILEIDNPKACGLGAGDECCAFLVVGAGGFECARTMDGIRETIRARLAAGTFNAKYDPGITPFPECQTNRVHTALEEALS